MNKTAFPKEIMAICIAALLTLPNIAVADDIEVAAEIGSIPPEILNVSKLRDNGDTENISALDPEVEYLIKFTVRDNNSLADLDTILVRVYESTQSDQPVNKRRVYNFTYNETANAWTASPSGYLNPSHTSTVPDNKSQVSFSFDLYFKLAGIAVPTGSTTNWIVSILVTDEDESTDLNDSTTFDVNEYRALNSYTASFTWSGKNPGDILENRTINPTITANLQVDINTNGSDLTYGAYSIPVSSFHVYNSTGPLRTLSSSTLTVYDNYAEASDSINPNITGYTDAVEKTLKYDGAIPNPQHSGTYDGTWTISLADIINPA